VVRRGEIAGVRGGACRSPRVFVVWVVVVAVPSRVFNWWIVAKETDRVVERTSATLF
jgi:hypothetical protein